MSATFKGVRLSARLTGEGVEQKDPFNKAGARLFCNEFRVSVAYEGRRASFMFHGSHNDFQAGIIELDDKALGGALFCWLSDARAGADSFADFCSEFGYDEDSKRAEKIHKACQRAAKQLERLGIPEAVIDYVNENYG